MITPTYSNLSFLGNLAYELESGILTKWYLFAPFYCNHVAPSVAGIFDFVSDHKGG